MDIESNKLLECLLALVESNIGKKSRIYMKEIEESFPNANIEKVIEFLKEKKEFRVRHMYDHYDGCLCYEIEGCRHFLEITNIWG